MSLSGVSRQQRLLALVFLLGIAVLPGVILADHSIMAAVQAWRFTPLIDAMQMLTRLGYGTVDIGVPLVIGLAGWWRGRVEFRARGFWGAGVVAVAGILDQLIKNVSCRARPGAHDAGIFFATFPCFPAPYALASFPSGHATTAFAAAVVLTLWFPRGAVPFLGLAVLVGCSRVMLGVHFPSDVLAGALLGSIVATAAHAYTWGGTWTRDLEALRKREGQAR